MQGLRLLLEFYLGEIYSDYLLGKLFDYFLSIYLILEENCDYFLIVEEFYLK